MQVDAIGEPPFMVRGGAQAVLGDEAEVVADRQMLDAFLDGVGGPEILFDNLGRFLQGALIPHLREDDEPGAERHDDQHDQRGAGNDIAVDP